MLKKSGFHFQYKTLVYNDFYARNTFLGENFVHFNDQLEVRQQLKRLRENLSTSSDDMKINIAAAPLLDFTSCADSTVI